MLRSGLIAAAVLTAAVACGRTTERREARSTTRETTTQSEETIADGETTSTAETITTHGTTTTTRETTTRVTTTAGGRTVTDETTTTTRTSTGASDLGYLRIDLDERDCVEGWITMDVEVQLVSGGRTSRHDFNASCSFTKRETFTLAGLSCTAESGMCSDFMNSGRMLVACSDGRGLPVRAEERFPCPED